MVPQFKQDFLDSFSPIPMYIGLGDLSNDSITDRGIGKHCP